MPLDPTLSTQLQFPGTNTAGGLDTVGRFAQIQNAMNQARLFTQTFAARQRAGQLLAASDPNDPESGMRALMGDPQTAAFAPEIINTMRTAESTLLDLQGKQQSQTQSAFQSFLKSLPAAYNNPDMLPGLVKANLAQLPPGARVLPQVREAYGDVLTSLMDGLPQGSAGGPKFQQRLQGLMLAGGATPEMFDRLVGVPFRQEAGGTLFGGIQAPAGSPTPGALQFSTKEPILPGPSFQPTGPGGALEPTTQGRSLVPPSTMAVLPAGPEGDVGPAGSPGPAPMAMPSPALVPGRPAVGLSASEKSYQENRGKDMADYQKSLDDRVAIGTQVMQTVSEAQDALKAVRAGGGANAYAKVAQLAQAFGAPNDIVDKISNGDLAASQEFSKLMVNTTMGQIREQLQGIGGSRLSQLEFNTFQKNNPNLDTDPRAIEKIFNFWTRIYNRDSMEQQELNKYIDSKGDINRWPAQWQQIMKNQGIVKTGTQDIGSATSAGGPTMEFIPGKGLVPIQSR